MFTTTVSNFLSPKRSVELFLGAQGKRPRGPKSAYRGLERLSSRACTYVAMILMLALSLASNGFAQTPIITTYSGPQLPTGGPPALTQTFDNISSVVSDGAGGFYFSDLNYGKVYRVTADGTLHLIAGSTYGFSGDGGQAASAQLAAPRGIAVDIGGNLYIADGGNQRIRKVTPTGVISTVAGNGTAGFGGDGGQAASAQLNGPIGAAVDAGGNLYIAELANQRVRKVTPAGVISTVAGNGTSGFSGDGGPATSAQLADPRSVAVDAGGNLYIADGSNQRIRKVTPAGVISTVAGNGTPGFSGDGPATSVRLATPMSVAVDADGNLLIAEYGNNRIRILVGGLLWTVAGNGTVGFSGDGGQATSAQLNFPYGAAVDASGNIFIADTGNHRIRKVALAGVISTVAGGGTSGFGGDGGQATSAQLNYPFSAAVDASGNLYIADTSNHRARKVTPAGVISTVAGTGYGVGVNQMRFPEAVAVDAGGNLYIADSWNSRILEVTPAGIIITVAGNGTPGFGGDDGPATSAKLSYPSGVAVDASGNLYIAELANQRVRKVTPAGIINTVAGNGTSGFGGDGGPATSAQLASPRGVAVDAGGNLYIADMANHRIRKVTPAGVINTVAGIGTPGFSGDGGPATSAQFNGLYGVAVDADGNLYVADSRNNRIRQVTPAGVINTVAGIGTAGFGGDGGPATSAQLAGPRGVAVDAGGNLYIADTNNSRVRKVSQLGSSLALALSSGGAATASTAGGAGPVQAGYALLSSSSGNPPYGTAVFSFTQNGIVVSEVGVPASPPTTHASLFVDFRTNVPAKSDALKAGTISVNTGIAAVNRGTTTANLIFKLRDAAGHELLTGNGTLAFNSHMAKFIDQLTDIAPDFVMPGSFSTITQFGVLEITSDQPVSILALRLTSNQRGDTLLTSTPIADLTRPLVSTPSYFPQLADGGGWQTTLMLINTSAGTETGQLLIYADNGSPLTVRDAGGSSGSAFRYSVPRGGVFIFKTDGSPTAVHAGAVQLVPDAGNLTPVGAGLFSYSPGGTLVTESGVPASTPTIHARVYVDTAGGHLTGLAIANPGNAAQGITINAYQMDGTTPAGSPVGPLQLNANGHAAAFTDSFVSGLPAGFTGVLDIAASTPFAALTLRTLNNGRDQIYTTFPVADLTQPPPTPIVFPQIADGGQYRTQFILLSAGGAVNTTLSFFDDHGSPMAVGKLDH
jgi:trimeric autotransporter adhesin